MINNEFIGNSVMTQYNRKIYRVDRIDFGKCPTDCFTLQDGT